VAALVAAVVALWAWIFDRSAADAALLLAAYLTVSRLVTHPLVRRLRPVE